ncbi:MAG: hypothetical protein QOC66_948 [Pseudonocardiales bacterium]|jgi:hypothetical protein|nr:hypothetical protein [Pseudonocardiales bacterium]
MLNSAAGRGLAAVRWGGRRVGDGDEFVEGDWEFKAFALPTRATS